MVSTNRHFRFVVFKLLMLVASRHLLGQGKNICCLIKFCSDTTAKSLLLRCQQNGKSLICGASKIIQCSTSARFLDCITLEVVDENVTESFDSNCTECIRYYNSVPYTRLTYDLQRNVLSDNDMNGV